jgi:hypothetical protein
MRFQSEILCTGSTHISAVTIIRKTNALVMFLKIATKATLSVMIATCCHYFDTFIKIRWLQKFAVGFVTIAGAVINTIEKTMILVW